MVAIMKTIAAVIIYKGRFYKSPECMYIIMSGLDYGAVLVRHGGLPAIVYMLKKMSLVNEAMHRAMEDSPTTIPTTTTIAVAIITKHGTT